MARVVENSVDVVIAGKGNGLQKACNGLSGMSGDVEEACALVFAFVNRMDVRELMKPMQVAQVLRALQGMHTHKGIMAALQQNLSGGQADAQYWAVVLQNMQQLVYRPWSSPLLNKSTAEHIAAERKPILRVENSIRWELEVLDDDDVGLDWNVHGK